MTPFADAVRLGRIGFDHLVGYLEDSLHSLEARPELIVRTERLSPVLAAERLASNEPPQIVDVRAPREYEAKHIAGSLNVPLNHLAERNPRHPSAAAWLVQWHVLQVLQGWSRDFAEDAQLARERSQAALLADPQSPLAVSMEGYACVHLDKDLAAPLTGRNGRHPLPDPRTFAAWLSRMGVSADKRTSPERPARGRI